MILELLLRRPKVTLLAFFGLCGLGLTFFLTLPRQEDPDFDWRKAEIVTVYPGADPATIDAVVTKPLEDALSTVEDVIATQAESRSGVSYIGVELRSGADYEAGFQRLRDKVDALARTLPDGAEPPRFFDGDDLIKTTAVLLVLTADDEKRYGPLALLEYARQMQRELERMPRIASAELQGPPSDDVEVELDLGRLAKFRVDADRILAALRARNARLPTGALHLGARRIAVRTRGRIASLHEIGDTIVDVTVAGDVVRLRDLARVRRGSSDPRAIVRFDGARAVAIGVFPRKGTDVAVLSARLRARLGRLRAKLPKGVQLKLVYDQSESVRRRFELLNGNLLQGMLLVLATLCAFLGPRQALVAAFCVPVTLMLGLVYMGLAGVVFHQFSLVGIVVALGLLVDNVIVVVENASDHLALRQVSPFEAVLRSTREVWPPILASTLTTVAAYVPLLLMGGDTGTFIEDLPRLVIVSLLASLLVAFGLTPLLMLLAFRRGIPAARRGVWSALVRGREAVVGRLVAALIRLRRRRLVVSVLVMATIVGSGFLVPLVGTQLFPKADRPSFVVQLTLAQGTDIAETDRQAQAVAAYLRSLPETAHVATFCGRAVPHYYYSLHHVRQASHVAQLLWQARPAAPGLRSVREVARALRAELPVRAPAATIAVRELEQGPPIQAPIVLRMRGDDIDALRREAATLRRAVRAVDGVSEAYDSYGQDAPSVDLDLDLDKANLLGLTRGDVARSLAVLLAGGRSTSLSEGDRERSVVVKLARGTREDIRALEDLVLRSPHTGESLMLRQVARLRLGRAVSRIERHDRRRSIDVEVWVDGRLASHVLRDVKEALATYRPPRGFDLEVVGESEEIASSFRRLAIAAAFALLLVYVILVAQFNSLQHPVVVLSVLPFAIAAAIGGLYLTGNPISFPAAFGFASLSGIVVNDAILLVEFVNQARRDGMDLADAVDAGTRRRVKPILSTTLTTIGGLLPLALSGSDLWAPLCYVVIFGLGASTLGTLVFLPLVYEIGERIRGGGPRRRPRVLVIDDESDVIELLEDLLADSFEVEGTTDPSVPLESVRRFDPDAVIVDFMMPGRDGLDIVKALREVRRDLVVVMLTAHAGRRIDASGRTHNLGAEAILRGADAFVSKTDVGELEGVLETALARPARDLGGRLQRWLRRLGRS